ESIPDEPRSGDARPQTPWPSMWPVGFALGIVCLLVGVLLSPVAAEVGAALAAVFAALWIRDVSARRTRAAAPAPVEGEAVTTAPAVPAHEGEAGMPEPTPAEVERFPRSKFLEGATLGIGGLIGGAVTVPAVGLMVVPAFVGQGHKPIDAGPLSDYPEGQ